MLIKLKLHAVCVSLCMTISMIVLTYLMTTVLVFFSSGTTPIATGLLWIWFSLLWIFFVILFISALRHIWCFGATQKVHTSQISNNNGDKDESWVKSKSRDKLKEIENRLITKKFLSTEIGQDLRLERIFKGKKHSFKIEVNGMQKANSENKELEDLEIGRHKTINNEGEVHDKLLTPDVSPTSTISRDVPFDRSKCIIKSCDICLSNYVVNEEICWSRNKECRHTFHKICMVDWLMKSPNCPICKKCFLYDDPVPIANGQFC